MVARIALFVLYIALATAKLTAAPWQAAPITAADGDPPASYLPVLAAAFEVVVGVLFLVGRTGLAACLGCTFFCIGYVTALLGTGRECGCLGGWLPVSGRFTQASAAAVGGLVTALGWWVSQRGALLHRGASLHARA